MHCQLSFAPARKFIEHESTRRIVAGIEKYIGAEEELL